MTHSKTIKAARIALDKTEQATAVRLYRINARTDAENDAVIAGTAKYMNNSQFIFSVAR